MPNAEFQRCYLTVASAGLRWLGMRAAFVGATSSGTGSAKTSLEWEKLSADLDIMAMAKAALHFGKWARLGSPRRGSWEAQEPKSLDRAVLRL